MAEDKQKICDKLLETLRATRKFSDLINLEYVKEQYDDFVIVTYGNGHRKKVTVTCDSGMAMIMDIMHHIV